MYKELSASYKMQAYTFTPESDDLFSLLFFALLKCLWKNSLCIWHRQLLQCLKIVKKVASKILASEASYWSSVHYMLLHSALFCTMYSFALYTFIFCTLFHSALFCTIHSFALCTLLYPALFCTIWIKSWSILGKEGNLIFLVKILAFY